jgi:hypothetical protein
VKLQVVVIISNKAKQKLDNTEMWVQFRSRIFEVIVTNRPLVGNGIPQSTAKYCLEKENLVQELLKEFGDDTEQSLCSFFYVFAKEFVTQLQMAVVCRAGHH